ncbi:MAG TPA: hypothetical protein VHR15_15640, partial [Ktedonobacterales bacterium]|nr:hypothetical protein [Ktedonobacterales bacterium]
MQTTSSEREQSDLPERRQPKTPRRRGHRAIPFALTTSGLLALTLAGCSLGSSTGAATNGSRVGQSAAPTVVVPPSAADLQQTVVNVIRTVQPSVVEITSSGNGGGAVGSGEIITD